MSRGSQIPLKIDGHALAQWQRPGVQFHSSPGESTLIARTLAKEFALGANTIRCAEVAEEGTSLTVANELAIRRSLEAAGVEFIDDNGGGPGVRLRKPEKSGK